MSEDSAAAPGRPASATVAGRPAERAAELLRELIRHDTSNPPGNEGEAQEVLAATLSEAGFECELAAREPGRANLVARLEGERDGPTLCLLGHVDTVPADPEDWTFDPWSGELVDGEVRGRGAQDMKGQVAAEVAAATELARGGWRPEAGTLLVVVTADEEMGGHLGAKWLCEERPELVRCDMVVNEGGGVAVELGGRRLYTLCVGEKGVFRFQLRATGRAGHASNPALGDNALVRLAPYLGRLSEQPQVEPTEEGVETLEALLGEPVDGDAAALSSALERVRAADPTLAANLVDPALRVTMVPTKIRASRKENVIPARAEALVDCRAPLGWDEREVGERAAALLGDGEYEIEFVERTIGNRSPSSSALATAISESLAATDPGAGLVPVVFPAFSDSHWFRAAFECVAYGFFPQPGLPLAERDPLMHGADERIPLVDLELATELYADLLRRVLG